MTIKRMDLAEFRAIGLLQEVNRLFFHPMGLALEMIVETEACECGAPRASTIHRVESPDPVIAGAAHEFKLQGPTFGGVWDYRDDPEGMAFGDPIDAEKAARVKAEFDRHVEERTRLFGDPIQRVAP